MNEGPNARPFRYMVSDSISNQEAVRLSAWPNDTTPSVFYVHYGILTRIKEKDPSVAQIVALPQSEVHILDSVDPNDIKHFCEQLCLDQVETTDGGKSVHLTHSRTWIELNNWRERSVSKVTEYLLWNDGDLWPHDHATEIAKFDSRTAWHGNGWLSLYQGNRQTQNPLEYESLRPRISNRAKDLARRLQVTNSADHTDSNLLGKNALEESKRDIALVLSRYLPRYWAPDYNRFLPYPRSLFGPVSWNGLLDERFTDLERAMILESWLTLWPNSTGLQLQPASLTLAYWAARVLDLPHSESPRNFLDGHDWEGWFGGRFNYKKRRTGH